MGLIHPTDLDAWSRWQQSRSPVRLAKHLLRRPAPPNGRLMVRGESPRVLIVLDATTPTSMASYIAPLQFLTEVDVAVLAPGDISSLLPGQGWECHQIADAGDVPAVLGTLKTVLAAGNYLPLSGAAYRWAETLGVKFSVVQHGLITPDAPPLPRNAHLLAFSEADAAFWSSGRGDLSHNVVGSQLLWEAASQPPSRGTSEGIAAPLFLGQLHGAELPRAGFASAARDFCLATGAVYRPHPSETDTLSRLQHSMWSRRGIRIDRSGTPLAESKAPVVSVFSTGVLEAAARGLPSWVTYRQPPFWLEEFWERYKMSRWGRNPTPAPPRAEVEPAKVIARFLAIEIGNAS